MTEPLPITDAQKDGAAWQVWDDYYKAWFPAAWDPEVQRWTIAKVGVWLIGPVTHYLSEVPIPVPSLHCLISRARRIGEAGGADHPVWSVISSAEILMGATESQIKELTDQLLRYCGLSPETKP